MSLGKDVRLNNECPFIQAYIWVERYHKNKPRLINEFPVLLTDILSDFLTLTHMSLANCHYLSVVWVLEMTPCKSLKVPKRVKELFLYSNNLHSMAVSHSVTNNDKTKSVTITPRSLLFLNVTCNPIFRLTLTSSLIKFSSAACESLIETRHKESIVRIIRFMSYYRVPRTRARSVRYYKLDFKGIWNYITFGTRGIYMDIPLYKLLSEKLCT